ncbi:hypothetical protein EVA_20521, partial [gut metagenome]
MAKMIQTSTPSTMEKNFHEFISTLTGRCFDVAEDIYYDVCHKVENRLNETFTIEGGFPDHFTFMDRLSQRIQSESYDEICENLEATIQQFIKEEVSQLSPAELLVLEYSTV